MKGLIEPYNRALNLSRAHALAGASSRRIEKGFIVASSLLQICIMTLSITNFMMMSHIITGVVMGLAVATTCVVLTDFKWIADNSDLHVYVSLQYKQLACHIKNECLQSTVLDPNQFLFEVSNDLQRLQMGAPDPGDVSNEQVEEIFFQESSQTSLGGVYYEPTRSIDLEMQRHLKH